MSVLGLDFGTANLLVAVTQRGGVDILANEASSRLTAYVEAIHYFGRHSLRLPAPSGSSNATHSDRIVLPLNAGVQLRRILVAEAASTSPTGHFVSTPVSNAQN